MPCDPRHRTLAVSSKLMISSISCHFRALGLTIFGSREDFVALCPPLLDSSGVDKTSVFRAFLAVFMGYSPRFLGPERIALPCNPRYTTLAASTKLVFSSISCRFRGL